MTGLRTDDELSAFITSSKPGTAVVEFGTTWCVKCHEMFPQFFALSKKVRQ
jgi:thiol-disulfide isomerase/thioredoxin